MPNRASTKGKLGGVLERKRGTVWLPNVASIHTRWMASRVIGIEPKQLGFVDLLRRCGVQVEGLIMIISLIRSRIDGLIMLLITVFFLKNRCF